MTLSDNSYLLSFSWQTGLSLPANWKGKMSQKMKKSKQTAIVG